MEIKNNGAPMQFVDPYEIIKQLNVKKSATVADFGCGSGYFSIPFAKTIGKEGTLYALDVLPEALEAIEGEAKTRSLSNIKTKRVDLEKESGSKLDSESMDWVVVKDILFQNKNKKIIIEEAYRVLKPGGKILIMEWNDSNFSVGPDAKIRVSSNEVEKIVSKENFVIEKNIKAGDFHYIIVAVK